MEEEWRNLARKVTRRLFSIGFDIERLLVAVARTRSTLDALVPALQERLAEEAPRGEIDWSLLGWASAYTGNSLNDAIRELVRLNKLHARDHKIFLLYGRHAGLEGSDDAAWLNSKHCHADALRHTEAALQRLRAAASLTRAADDAIRSAAFCPRASLRWDGSMKTAIQLATYATISAAMAICALCCLCVAVAMEFHDVSAVVNR